MLNLEEFSDRIERFVSLSKEKVVSIGMRLREEARKLFNREKIERKLIDSFMSILN